MRHPTAALLLLFACTGAIAQAPLEPPPTQSLNERLQADAEDARWRWGSVRVQPTLTLGEVRWVDDVFVDSAAAVEDETTDLVVGVGGGLHLYQPVGERSALAFFVEPQYDWWQDLEDRRRLNFSFGAAASLDLNRFFLDLEALRREDQSLVTREAEQIINARTDQVDGILGIPIYRSLALALDYRWRESANLLDEEASELVPDFRRLDETTDTATLGLRLEPGRITTLFVGWARRSSESDTTRRNYEGEGPSARVEVRGGAFDLNLRVERLALEAEGPSTFQRYERTNGAVFLRFGPGEERPFTLFASRDLTPSIRSTFLDFETDRYGGSWSTPVGSRMRLLLSYTRIDRSYRASPRGDEQALAGLDLDWRVGSFLRIGVQVQRSEIESTIDEFDRDSNRVGLTFGLTGLSWP